MVLGRLRTIDIESSRPARAPQCDLKIIHFKLGGYGAHFYPSTQEAEACGFLSLRSAGLQIKFQDNQGYKRNPVSINKQTNKMKYIFKSAAFTGLF